MMKPIHHSKLKAGDLIYVESIMVDLKTNPLSSYLLEVFSAGEFGFTGTNGITYFHFSGIGVWEHFFLIERGYFL